MRWRRWGELAARTSVPVLAVAVVATAVAASPRLVGDPPERAGRQEAARHAVPVRSTTLSCPGPVTPGTPVQVLAASAPRELRPVVRAPHPQPGPPSVSVLTLTPPRAPAEQPAPTAGSSDVRTVLGAAPASQPTGQPSGQPTGQPTGEPGGGLGAVLAVGRGAAAPGLVAEQWASTTSGDHRGLTGATCLAPQDDLWLVGGGDQEGRRGRLVLSNPHDSSTQVSIDVHGTDGLVPRTPGSSVVLAPRSRTEVLLDALAPGATAPVVHVRTAGASVGAVLRDGWLDGLVPRGVDDAVAATAPSRRVLVPGLVLPAKGSASVRIAVPGTSQGVAQVRLWGPDGEVQVPGADVVRVPAGSTREVDLGRAPAGSYGISVHADVPVVAAARVEERPDPDGPSDFAWSASAEPVADLAGGAVPDGPGAGWSTTVLLTAVGAATGETLLPDPLVDVVGVQPDGEQRTRTVVVPRGTTVAVPVSGRSVWVRPQPGRGPVVAARAVRLEDPRGALVTVSPLRQVLLRQVPVDVVPLPD